MHRLKFLIWGFSMGLECEFFECEVTALLEFGHKTFEVCRFAVRFKAFLILPCFDDLDMIIGCKAAKCFIAYATFIVE